MGGCHQDADQQPCTSTDSRECKQLQGHLAEEPDAESASFADLPQPWLKLLIHQLDPQDRDALFRTGSGMAAAVAQHSPRLKLTPAAALLDSNRRKFVLKLAASSSNLCLYAESHVIPLDVSDVWQSIKKLWVINIDLSAANISDLHLQQLKHLHTLKLREYWRKPIAVDTAAVQHVMQAGGLPALRTLQCAEEPEKKLKLLQQLAPVMGHRVTELIAGSPMAITAIDKWPALQKVKMVEEMDRYYGNNVHATCSEALKQVFSHPNLQEAVLACNMCSNASSIDHASFSPAKLKFLELSNWSGPYLADLQHVPLHAVRQLRFHTGLRGVNGPSDAAVQHLNQCSEVQIVPSSWDNFKGRYGCDNIAGSTPTWATVFDPFLLDWLLPKLSMAEGALVLSSDALVCNQGPVGRADMARLQLLPPGIHTLKLTRCAVDKACTWGQLVAQVPKQVQSLLIHCCAMTREDFEGVLAQPPPAGLQMLHLAQDHDFMSWVGMHDEELSEFRAAVSAKWPGVRLHLDIWDKKWNKAASSIFT